MSAATVCNGTSAFQSILMQPSNKDLESSFQKLISSIPTTPPLPLPKEAELPPGQFDIWSSIQAQRKPKQSEEHAYVHPLMRRSSSLLSQKSLEICTESLGSETGSDDYFSSDDEIDFFSGPARKEQQQRLRQTEACRKQLTSVNYHCSTGRRSSLPRSFPPPLPSLSRHDGPCLQMRPHRRDGRLVMEAVSIPSQNYLHAKRQNGRLLLSFVNSAAATSSDNLSDDDYADATKVEEQEQEQEVEHEEEAEAEEDEEEEVEVVDRGTVVEVKVSTQPQQNSTIKVHRSSIVINKFVSCMPTATNEVEDNYNKSPLATMKTTPTKTTTTTAAAAAVAASSVSATSAYNGGHSSTDNKLLFTSKRRNREELLRDLRRCSELRKPLFIWEPYCIATSS